MEWRCGCPTCMQAKFTRYPFSSSEATAKAPLDEVVMDVVGPLKLGAAGAEYFLTIVDVYTRMTWVYVLSKKSDVAETVKTDWLPMVERQQDRLVKAIRTDRGGEFLSKEFGLWLKKNGIRHSLTMPYSPAMNGIAERANRTITETARGLLIEAGLPDYFWPDAVRSACVAKNRALTHVGADKWVPYVEWIGRKPKVDTLRVFGCMCMALVPKHLRHNKLGAKAIWAVHLGMAQNSKGWLLWDPFTKKFLVSRDCKLMENLMYKDWKAENEAKIGMRLGDVKSSGLEHVELPLELSSGSTKEPLTQGFFGGERQNSVRVHVSGIAEPWLEQHGFYESVLAVRQLVKNEMVAGIRVKGEPDEVLGCPTCMQAKFTRFLFSSSEATAKAPLDEVVMDVVGPLKLGAAGAEYFLTIVDVYTRMTWVYVLSKKSDVAETVKTDWLPMVERQQDRLVKAIRTDRGGEFLSKEFGLWLKKNGIRHSLTMPYSPAMNGIAERANRKITETARGLLIEAGLPDYFWPDAVRSACVAKNRALTHVGADKWVPYVEWIGRKPKVDMLRVFGCMCMALVPKHLRHNKLGAKAIWAVHLGMAQKSKGWLLWDPFTKKFLVSRDCKFMENLMYKDWKVENETKIGMRLGDVKSSGLEHVELPLELSSSSTTTRQSSLVNGGDEAKDAEEEEEEVQQVSERAPTLPSRITSAPRIHVPAAEEEGRGKRRIQAPNRLTYEALGKPAKSALAGAALMVGEDEESDYEECAFAFFSPVEMPGEPGTLKEALESSDAEEWKKAMEGELKSIEENGTWELVELPEGRKAITSKWLFKIKSDADGKIERYKSRLVAKGYQQKEKVDYKELFAPVVKPTTLRTLLATLKDQGGRRGGLSSCASV
ncbi:unnamed protein product [Closterium sp. NIES-53]